MYKKFDNCEALNSIGPSFEELSPQEMELSDGMGGWEVVAKYTVKVAKFTSVYCYVGLTVSIITYTVATN